jgi:DNA-binding MarR family transcriptional regulator
MASEFEQAPAVLRRLPSRLLAQAAGHAERLVSDRLAEIDAHKWHFAVLAALAEHGPGSQSTLSRRTGIYRSDMVAVLNVLAERGFVERTPDSDDRRRNIVTVTEPGLRRLARLGEVLAESQDELLTPLTTADRTHLVQLLTRIVEHHNAARPWS